MDNVADGWDADRHKSEDVERVRLDGERRCSSGSVQDGEEGDFDNASGSVDDHDHAVARHRREVL